MAFREMIYNTPDNDPLIREGLFNVTMAVGNKEVGTGASAANQPTDMMLVYYFLFYIYRCGDRKVFGDYEWSFSTPSSFPISKNYNSTDMKHFLPILILRFQNAAKKDGRRVFVDGRCDRARGKTTSVTHSSYTIHCLNFYYLAIIKRLTGRSDWQNFLMGDPLAPPQLRQELASNKLS